MYKAETLQSVCDLRWDAE